MGVKRQLRCAMQAYDDMKRSGKVEEYKKRQMTLAEAQTAYKTGDVSKAQNLLQRMREGRG